ncbi:hypothetical protein [Pseudodesulfovibrio sediminis]|uniref:DUF2007 domain-containing protein n=1 Tax=Pseudodesulfovibrio sediminis TaxID=2810563 RepID=A0ABN6EWM8_9BACT|nr:hypothetical protein [Pseudodesulfovibrio sediminis]BCS89469.1 hypothetical protein PSDVSF_27110 [Pseudodesulfovibrio sediminis]
MDRKCAVDKSEQATRLEALFAEQGVLLEVGGMPVQRIREGLVEVGSWGMVGKYMPVEEAEELLFGGSD